jgi:8-amino-3,8-dideoxy-alpha-D-manno-octulosonate transaminase
VILPAFSWFSCYESIVALGALPVFCEIDRSLNIDPDDAERRITPRTKAVIAVHYQGSPADLGRLADLAARRGVRLLEDCAQAIGARYRGRFVGTLGDVGTCSLQGNKLITSGEGGLVITRDPRVFERAVRYHDLGFVRPTFKAQLAGEPQEVEFAGSQFRMNEETAAVALAQFERLEWIVGRCHRLWCRLRERLAHTAPGLRFRRSHDLDGDAGITLYLDLETPERAAAFGEALAAEGIPLGPSSGMTNLLRQPIVANKGMPHPGLPPFGPGGAGERAVYSPDLAPRTDEILNSMLAIPIGPRYTLTDVEDIATAVGKVHQSTVDSRKSKVESTGLATHD